MTQNALNPHQLCLQDLHVLLVDDHALVRAGLAMAIEGLGLGQPRLSQASSVAEALQVVREVGPPDLVLLDIHMPGLSGLEGMALIRRAAPMARVAIVSASVDADCEKQALELGADGFIHKALTMEALGQALHVLCQGSRYFPGAAAQARQAACATAPASSSAGVGLSEPEPAQAVPTEPLNARQLEILRLIAQGNTNKVIGRKLSLAENTVRFYVSQILSQLGCSTRSEAAYRAQQWGLL